MIAALGLVLVASTAVAQGGGPPQGGPGGGQGRMNEMLFKDITLTDAQKAKIDTIQMKQREDSRALMQPGGGMMDSTTRAKMAELRTKSYAEIRKVLTAEQQPIFDKNLAAMPAPGQGRRPPTLR
jgi:Spy/CpxP family protein refolding chaperone